MQADDKLQINPIASNESDHDERGEKLATEVDWDKGTHDAMTEAAEHLAEFKRDGVALSDEDWAEEEEEDDKYTDHVDALVDSSLEGVNIEEFDGIDPDEQNEAPNNS